jgi:DNA-binding response OmpR family regulator
VLFRVYYLDDEPDLLEMFADTFGSAEVEVTTFTDPKKAVEAIQSRPPDLLFLDYRLPNTTGDKVALLLDPKIPKALITGDLTVNVEAKFEVKFEKPIPIEKVEKFIQFHKSRHSG